MSTAAAPTAPEAPEAPEEPEEPEEPGWVSTAPPPSGPGHTAPTDAPMDNTDDRLLEVRVCRVCRRLPDSLPGVLGDAVGREGGAGGTPAGRACHPMSHACIP